jgi:hypothetical protein
MASRRDPATTLRGRGAFATGAFMTSVFLPSGAPGWLMLPVSLVVAGALALIFVVALSAACARRPSSRSAALRTLELLLQALPWYRRD